MELMVEADVSSVVGVVYGIREADSEEYRYIGQTSTSIKKRWAKHRAVARSGRRTPLYDWMRSKGDPELEIDVLELVFFEREELGIAEMAWIQYLREKGDRLLNISAGGLGPTGLEWTAQQRELARERSTGRPGTPRFGEANPFFGKTHSEEQRARWSVQRAGNIAGAKNPNYGKTGAAHPAFGRTLSEETRQRLSEQKRGELDPNFGKKASAETRSRMSAARKGVPRPSSARSAHTRYHTNKGVISPNCRFCVDDSTPTTKTESEKRP